MTWILLPRVLFIPSVKLREKLPGRKPNLRSGRDLPIRRGRGLPSRSGKGWPTRKDTEAEDRQGMDACTAF